VKGCDYKRKFIFSNKAVVGSRVQFYIYIRLLSIHEVVGLCHHAAVGMLFIVQHNRRACCFNEWRSLRSLNVLVSPLYYKPSVDVNANVLCLD